MMQLGFLLQAGVCLASTGFIAISWYMLLAVLARSISPAVRLLLSLILLWTQLVLVTLALGLTGQLYRFSIVSLNLGISVAVTVVSFVSRRRRHTPDMDETRFLSLPGSVRWLRTEYIAAAALLAAGFAFAWYTALAIFFPPLGYDDLWYHLPGAAFALQNRALTPVEVPPGMAFMNYYPQVSEFLSLWCFALLGSDAMANLWQSWVYVHFLLAAFLVCRLSGFSRAHSLFATGLVGVTPTLVTQLLTTYNDLFVAALFASALVFAIAAGIEPRRVNIVGLGLSCGGLLASKLTAPFLCAIVLGVFIALRRFRRAGLPRISQSLLVVLLIAFAGGGYWYLRNLVDHGNPIYPFKVSVAGFELLSGTRDPSSWAADRLNPELAKLPRLQALWKLWLEEKSHYGYWFYNYDSAYTGFGPVWFVLGLPSILSGTLLAVLQKRWETVAIVLFTTGAFFAFSGNISVRYTLFMLPIMALGIACTLDSMQTYAANASSRTRVAIARTCLASVQGFAMLLAFFTIGLTAFSVKSPAAVRAQLLESTVSKATIDSPVLGVFAPVRTTLPSNAVVIFDESFDFIYALWRPDWANKVFFVSSAQPFEAWSAQCTALNATHFFTNKDWKTPAGERSPVNEWMVRKADKFNRVFVAPNFGELYELR